MLRIDFFEPGFAFPTRSHDAKKKLNIAPDVNGNFAQLFDVCSKGQAVSTAAKNGDVKVFLINDGLHGFEVFGPRISPRGTPTVGLRRNNEIVFRFWNKCGVFEDFVLVL